MPLITLISGIFLLLFGKKTIHIFSCAAGFFLSYQLIPSFFPTLTNPAIIAISIGIAVLFLILTRFVKNLVVFLIGFIGGGLVIVSLSTFIPFEIIQEIPNWGIFLIGGTLGLILAATLLDWTLMLLSTFFGAYLIISLIHLAPLFNLVIYLFLAIFGFYIQYNSNHKKRPLTTT